MRYALYMPTTPAATGTPRTRERRCEQCLHCRVVRAPSVSWSATPGTVLLSQRPLVRCSQELWGAGMTIKLSDLSGSQLNRTAGMCGDYEPAG